MEALLRREIITTKACSRMFALAVFIVLTALGAFVRLPLPFSPVPVTLQTFFVLLAGAMLGKRLGLISQLGYVLIGCAGLPIFAGAGSGLLYLSGPTAGYLLGFIPAAVYLGSFAGGRQRSFASTCAHFLLADGLIFLFGMIWLKLLLGYTFAQVVMAGLLPFIPGEIIKTVTAARLYMRFRSRIHAALF